MNSVRAHEETGYSSQGIPMFRLQKIREDNPVGATVAVLKKKNDLCVAYPVQEMNLRTKAHRFARRLLSDQFQTVFNNPAYRLDHAVFTIRKSKLCDFPLVV